jgi:hypothetical protein
MKKFLAGCLVGLLLLGVLVGATLYLAWGYIHPVVTTVTDVASGASRLGEAVDIDRDLRNTGTFEPPVSGELTADQVTRFVRVQQQTRAALGDRAGAFADKYRDLSRQTPGGTVVVPSLPDLAGGVKDLSAVYLEAWRAQVAAMNDTGFSRSEFSWVRLRVYQAAGLEAARYDARDLADAIGRVAEGANLDVPTVTLPDAPAANRALVAPHRELIRSWLGMAFFGL